MITKIELHDYETLKMQALFVNADKETMAIILDFITELNKEQQRGPVKEPQTTETI